MTTHNKNIADLRENYRLGNLRRIDLPHSPFDLFRQWFAQTLDAGITEPNAMVLSTSSPDGKPSARIVLMKDLTEDGIAFFTNYQSKKGNEIAENPHVALLFPWIELERQVRIEGTAQKISHETSDKYFHSRPVSSRLGTWASEQSRVVPSRETLDSRMERFLHQYKDEHIPRPEYWGGYLVTPNYFEFWQGRENRLHDRFRYALTGE